MPGASSPVVFAVDAGATITRAVAVNSGPVVLWRGSADAASVSRHGVHDAADIVWRLWKRAVAEVGIEVVGNSPVTMAGGFAGARSLRIQEDISSAVSSLLFPDMSRGSQPPVSITHDVHIALVGAFDGEGAGGVLISGTGSICMIRSDTGDTILSGGWGWPLGDEGSATWVGWRAVQLGLESWEDGKPSRLTDLVIEKWDLNQVGNITPHDIMISAIEAGRDPARFASLAPGVHELALAGNRDAGNLVIETGKVLGRLVEGGCERLGILPGRPLPLAFMGSLAQAWQEDLENPVRVGAGIYGKDLQIMPEQMSPLCGAVLLAFEAAGWSTLPEVKKKLNHLLSEH